MMNKHAWIYALGLGIALAATPARAQGWFVPGTVFGPIEPGSKAPPAPRGEVLSSPRGEAPPSPRDPVEVDDFAVKEYWREDRPQLDFHPIGLVVPEGRLRLTMYTPLNPTGFQSDAYGISFAPTYGLGGGWQISIGGMEAERIGPGGEAIFYGGGIQKQLFAETRSRPALSIGAYGMVGPHDHHNENVYLVGTKRVSGGSGIKHSLYVHGGLKYDHFESDDYGSGSGVQPFVGSTFGFNRRFFVSAEYSPEQSMQFEDMFSVRGTYLFRIKGHYIGFSGGISSNGYDTHPFISFSL